MRLAVPWIRIVLLAAANVFSHVACADEPAAADWPQFRHDAARSGYNPTPVPARRFAECWSRRFVNDRLASVAQPIVVGDKIFIGTEKGRVYALGLAHGEDAWQARLDGAVSHTLAATGSTVFAATLTGGVYALDGTTGKQVWEFHASGNFASAILLTAERQSLCVADRWGKLYCLDAKSGKPLWKQDLGAMLLQGPSYGNGRIYIGSEDLRLHGLDAETGKVLWSSTAVYGGGFRAYAPVYAEEKIIVNVAPGGTGELTANDPELMREANMDISSHKDLSKAMDAAVKWLQNNPRAQTFYVFNAATGQHPYVPSVLQAVVNQAGVQPPPVYANAGT